MVSVIVIYGLGGWPPSRPRRTVPEIFDDRGTIVFGWVLASHQIEAAVAALGAGTER
jgi:hypothetical protein